MNSTSYEVAIIGGGLGGLTMAVQLANAGVSCILFEKNRYPFHRVCGEYISMESWDFLSRLGLDLDIYDGSIIRRLRVSSPSGNAFEHLLDLGGFGISRYQLDHDLYKLAKQKGVTIKEEEKVLECDFRKDAFTLTTNRQAYTSHLCIGAWGKQSNLDTGMSRSFLLHRKSDRNYVGVKYHVKLPFPDDLIELHNFENGYCGISRVENGKSCLCYLTASENLKRYKGDIRKMEQEIIMKNPFLKSYFESAQFFFQEPLTISQINIGYKGAVEKQVLLLGDAAGSIAPLSGNGMSMAMRASAMLFPLIKKYLDKEISREELNGNYENLWKAQFKRRVQLSAVLQKLLKSRFLANSTITILKRTPALRNALVKSTHGQPF
jgi:flavin-dependent dehydrogenase